MTPRKSFEMTVRMENRLWWRNLLVAPVVILIRAPLVYFLFTVAEWATWLGGLAGDNLPGFKRRW